MSPERATAAAHGIEGKALTDALRMVLAGAPLDQIAASLRGAISVVEATRPSDVAQDITSLRRLA